MKSRKKQPASKKRKPTRGTPIRKALRPESELHTRVQDAANAIKAAHSKHIDEQVRQRIADSVDIDAAFEAANPNDHRWDYLLGYQSDGRLLAVEPHSAKSDEVSVVIAKRRQAIAQLEPHLRAGVTVAEWFWVASGEVHFADTERTRRRLDQNGIRFVGRQLLLKHVG